VASLPPRKINLISCGPMDHVSDIKLIRTDTTLDLSQKAEKGMLNPVVLFPFYNTRLLRPFLIFSVWDYKDFPTNLKVTTGAWRECVDAHPWAASLCGCLYDWPKHWWGKLIFMGFDWDLGGKQCLKA
jgi:hypothetical protein